MSFEMRRSINNVEVRPSAQIVGPISSQPVLGKRLSAGAVCQSLGPESCVAVITADSAVVWQSDSSFSSYEAADRAARDHTSAAIDHALREKFA